MPSNPIPPVVLAFAASDPTGGAGIQADLLTLSSLGCHPLSVLTALTVQDSAGVGAVLAVDPGWVRSQARALLEDMAISAFKIGMLGSVENIAVIAEIVSGYPDIPLVLDPVLASGRGDAFCDEDMIDALNALLLPQVTLLTPNSLEARRLAGNESGEENPPDLAECARRLVGGGAEFVLITGTHEPGAQVVNSLYDGSGLVRADAWQRLPGSYHGSGCTLASAIAAGLARGLDTGEAVRAAQDYTWQTLAHGFRPGMGQHFPDRFFLTRNTT